MNKYNPEVGDRVKLVSLETRNGHFYSKSTSNTVGNIGTVYELRSDYARVNWDNGSYNSYCYTTLQPLRNTLYKDE